MTATADPSFSDEILQTNSGPTTAWLPLTTPWVSIEACSSQIYGAFGTGPVIAFDPYYGSVIASSQIPCLPPEATVWYNPPADGNTVYVLGPTFVCPAAYYAARTLAVNSATRQILCCPTSYTLGPTLTNNPRTDFPGECYSTCTSGEYITYMTQSVEGGSWTPFTRGIQSDPFTVFGVFVNGFNVIASTTSSSSSSSTSPPTSSTIPASTTSSASTPTFTQSINTTPNMNTSSGLSSGAAAGIGVGVTAAVAVLAILGFFLYRRRKRNTNQHEPTYPSEPATQPQTEMGSQNKILEYYGAAGPAQELPTQNPQTTFELH